MIRPGTIIEAINMAEFRENADVTQLALSYDLGGIIEGQPSIRKKEVALITYLSGSKVDEKLKENIVIELVNKKLENLERIGYEDVFESEYSKLFQLLKEDGFQIKDNRLVKEGEMVPLILTFDSKFVIECLNQCDTLIINHSYGAAVDRAHTALHGYLKEIINRANLVQFIKDSNPKIQDCWSVLRQHHPKLQFNKEDYLAPINQIINSVAKVIENINELRNQRSFSHPNEEILEEDEAKLIINFCRTILQYVDGRISS